MKISPLLGAINFLNVANKGAVARDDARAERDGENGRDQYTRQPKDENGESADDPGNRQQFHQKMEQAVQDFQEDPQTRASGIQASTEGSGPGLRIVVKDSAGSVIRQFTGEEFVKLREAVGSDKGRRGRIFDQKA